MSNWDSEIDDVARRMTDQASPSGFTDRVLAQIDDGAPRRRQSWPAWAWSPVAVVAAAVLAVFVGRAPWRSPSGEMRPEVRSASAEPKADPTSTNASDRVSLDSTHSMAGPRNANVGPSFSRTVALVAIRTGPAAPLAQASELTPPPIEIGAIGVESMETMESIDVPRLAVAELDVPAIGDE